MSYIDEAKRTSRTATFNVVRVDSEVACLTIANKSRGFTAEAIIDLADLPIVESFGRRWWAAWHKTTCQYMAIANAKINGRWTAGVLLHRLIMDAPKSIDVDHINHVMLDCRRSNLRLCSRSENLQNRTGHQRNSTSGVRGVSWDPARSRWRAHVTINRKTKLLGRFLTRDEAASVAHAGRARLMSHAGGQ